MIFWFLIGGSGALFPDEYVSYDHGHARSRIYTFVCKFLTTDLNNVSMEV